MHTCTTYKDIFLQNKNILEKNLSVKLSFLGYQHFLPSDCTCVLAIVLFVCLFSLSLLFTLVGV